jgi:hypothetical protein
MLILVGSYIFTIIVFLILDFIYLAIFHNSNIQLFFEVITFEYLILRIYTKVLKYLS